MSTFHLELISPEGIIFKDDAYEVTLPTPEGEITILPHHVSLFAKVSEGEIRIKTSKGNRSFAITGGFVEVNKNHVSVLCDYAIDAENIVVARAAEAKKRAEELLKNKKETTDFTIAEKEFQRSILELKVADKVKRRSV